MKIFFFKMTVLSSLLAISRLGYAAGGGDVESGYLSMRPVCYAGMAKVGYIMKTKKIDLTKADISRGYKPLKADGSFFTSSLVENGFNQSALVEVQSNGSKTDNFTVIRINSVDTNIFGEKKTSPVLEVSGDAVGKTLSTQIVNGDSYFRVECGFYRPQ